MAGDGQHCSFVLLAEFDIDRGAQLTYQFPQPLGMDETLLANLMLPDGAEKQSEDWTIFFLNQTPFNTIAPVLALETPELNGRPPSTFSWDADGGRPELLYVLNLVRTKIDKTVRRGAIVKAMAICTRHPFIQIFKPVLLMALDDYYSNPSQDCLARLFDAVNAMDFSCAPQLTRHEKLIMRVSERKDVFAEKFSATGGLQSLAPPQFQSQGKLSASASELTLATPNNGSAENAQHRSTNSWDSRASFEEGILMREKQRELPHPPERARHSPTDSLDESGVFVGNEPGMDTPGTHYTSSTVSSAATARPPYRGRRSTDASSNSSHSAKLKATISAPSAGAVKDTHSFQTVIDYKGHQLPIRMPLSTFPEEVGDYSLIQLIQTFTSPSASITGPTHPHLHTSGTNTHPIIILFNALVTGKRIVFLGHGRPAGQVSSYVLAACALGTGCGCVLRGFIERAFPYANLTNKDEWESIPAYIAGVTNPIFESSGTWDILCDVGSGRIAVHRDILINHPPMPPPVPFGAPGLLMRSGTLVGAEELSGGRTGGDGATGEGAGGKGDGKDNPDNLFMNDVIQSVHYHMGERFVRARIVEYVSRFVRLAARYEEDVIGSTEIGYRTAPFGMQAATGAGPALGSGMVFVDEAAGIREIQASASRIEAWRRTKTYHYYESDFLKAVTGNALRGFDVTHQIWRLRTARYMSDAEAELVLRTLADQLRSYDAVVELLSHLPPHLHGLLPLSFGLFHQSEVVRDLTVDIFNELRQYPVGVVFLQTLNHFQRYAYVRLAHLRESKQAVSKEPSGAPLHPPAFMIRTASDRDISLAA